MRKHFYFLVALCLMLSSCRGISVVKADRVCFTEVCVNVEVVSTPETMEKGLQGRTALTENGGMLFVFSQPDRQFFWMKDTLIPLDMIWMNEEREIVHVRPNVQPCQSDPCDVYGSPTPDALYVLEVSEGYVQRHGLKRGDRAEFQLK